MNVYLAITDAAADLANPTMTGNRMDDRRMQVMIGAHDEIAAYVTPESARKVAAAWLTLADQIEAADALDLETASV